VEDVKESPTLGVFAGYRKIYPDPPKQGAWNVLSTDVEMWIAGFTKSQLTETSDHQTAARIDVEKLARDCVRVVESLMLREITSGTVRFLVNAERMPIEYAPQFIRTSGIGWFVFKVPVKIAYHQKGL